MDAPAFAHVTCASLPVESLAALATLRARPGVVLTISGGRAWVRWRAGDQDVLFRLLPLPGAELYEQRDAHWHRHGRHLPAFDVPAWDDAQPLDRVLFPAPVEAVPPLIPPLSPVVLRLVPDDVSRPTRALLCQLHELSAWADGVPAARLASLRAARCGGAVLLLGERLPLLAGRRFWGANVLIPLGCRPEPALPESALRDALGAGSGELILLQESGPQLIEDSALRPLTRAAVRLAVSEGGA